MNTLFLKRNYDIFIHSFSTKETVIFYDNKEKEIVNGIVPSNDPTCNYTPARQKDLHFETMRKIHRRPTYSKDILRLASTLQAKKIAGVIIVPKKVSVFETYKNCVSAEIDDFLFSITRQEIPLKHYDTETCVYLASTDEHYTITCCPVKDMDRFVPYLRHQTTKNPYMPPIASVWVRLNTYRIKVSSEESYYLAIDPAHSPSEVTDLVYDLVRPAERYESPDYGFKEDKELTDDGLGLLEEYYTEPGTLP